MENNIDVELPIKVEVYKRYDSNKQARYSVSFIKNPKYTQMATPLDKTILYRFGNANIDQNTEYMDFFVYFPHENPRTGNKNLCISKNENVDKKIFDLSENEFAFIVINLFFGSDIPIPPVGIFQEYASFVYETIKMNAIIHKKIISSYVNFSGMDIIFMRMQKRFYFSCFVHGKPSLGINENKRNCILQIDISDVPSLEIKRDKSDYLYVLQTNSAFEFISFGYDKAFDVPVVFLKAIENFGSSNMSIDFKIEPNYIPSIFYNKNVIYSPLSSRTKEDNGVHNLLPIKEILEFDLKKYIR